MTPGADLWESDALRSLRRVSEARGLTFYVNPPREVVPDFLGDFQPDAIARGPDGGIVIQVKQRRSGADSAERLAEVARKMSGQKGWEFRAIYLGAAGEDMPAIATPTRQQLLDVFEEIEALNEGGHPAAALVAAWAALESLARLAGADGGRAAITIYSPIQAVQALAEEGHVENEAADRLRALTTLRNAVVHGDLSIAVPGDRVRGLLEDLRAIASSVGVAA